VVFTIRLLAVCNIVATSASMPAGDKIYEWQNPWM